MTHNQHKHRTPLSVTALACARAAPSGSRRCCMALGVIGNIKAISTCATRVLPLVFFLGIAEPVWSDESQWEYQVVILKGITAGGTIEKKSSGIFIDVGKTEALAKLAADGWEVLSVVGAPGADDTIYLRRPRSQ